MTETAAGPGTREILAERSGVGCTTVPVHELFASQAARTPDAVAVVAGDDGTTYRRLDDRAGRLAGRLAEHGVGRGAIVGILLERGTDLVVALMATLKAGAGYALLDPDHPAERLRGALADTAAVVLLTTSALAGSLPTGPGGPRVLRLDRVGPLDRPAAAPPVPVRPEDVACVMFTSGSTGRPKGVAVPHRALAGTYLHQDYAIFGPGEVWLQCSPVSWDAFALEVFGPLLSGGTCVLHPGHRPDPRTIAELVIRHRVTHLQLSASLFNYLVDDVGEAFVPLSVVYTGGERASVPHVAAALRRFPGLRVVNGYGPVESLGFTTCHPVRPEDLVKASIPVGRPVTHKDVLVLDARLRQVLPGGAGELYATGAGLALGYLGRPGATAERFLPYPAGPPGARMYRTGDIGHRTVDGLLEVTGRIDDQVKIRGFRVEPGEVEDALGRHPAVKDCMVVPDRTAEGEVRLAGYVSLRDGTDRSRLTYSDLREHLLARVPDHMVPASVTVLDALPLTANGKADRTALPAPDPLPARAAEPAGATEPVDGALMAAIGLIWAEVLGMDAVSAGDDFFALGGHSLHAVRVVHLLRHRLPVRVELRDLYDSATLAGFAAAVARATDAGPARRPPPLLARRGPR